MSAAPLAVVCGPEDDLARWIEAVRELDARVLLVARGLPDARRDAMLRAAGVRELADAREAVRVARREAADSHDAPGAVLLPTSGSSGTPRVVELPWSALEASARAGAARVPFGPGDLWHGSLSPAHVGGLMIQVRALVLGGSLRVAPPPRAWSDLDGCTHASLVAPQVAQLLASPDAPPSSLRAVLLGGGPSPASLHEEALRRGVPLFSTYGMTETASQIATDARRPGDPATLAGRPLDGVRIEVRSELHGEFHGNFHGELHGELHGETRSDPTQRDGVGEILVDGPMLARAVHLDGRSVSIAGPYATRDAGFLDAQGRLHIVGRLDAMFISGGRNIHPETIERALAAVPEVRGACVVGVPHEKWGMRPVAFVDLARAPARPLRALLCESLEPFLVPDAILAMPSDEAARMKPSRAALAARLAAGERFSEA